MRAAASDINMGKDEFLAEVEQISQKMNETIAVIREIDEKTQVINDIVFQTKLLSFNASVEAARAGDQGKGLPLLPKKLVTLLLRRGKRPMRFPACLRKVSVKFRILWTRRLGRFGR